MSASNSSELWALYFIKEMGCVGCGKPATRLVTSRREEVDAAKLPLKTLMEMVPTMDAWCDTCEASPTIRTRMKGRMQRKHEIAKYAASRRGNWYEHGSRNQVLREGVVVDKQAFYLACKSEPCGICNQSFDPICMEFVHVGPKTKRLGVFVNTLYTIDMLIDEMEKCTLVCSNCAKLIQYKDFEYPPVWKYDEAKPNLESFFINLSNFS